MNDDVLAVHWTELKRKHVKHQHNVSCIFHFCAIFVVNERLNVYKSWMCSKMSHVADAMIARSLMLSPSVSTYTAHALAFCWFVNPFTADPVKASLHFAIVV